MAGEESISPVLPPVPAPAPAPPMKAVLWDVGGVLLDWDPRHLYRKLFGADVAGMEEFLANVCTMPWHAQQDLGRSIDEACAELSKQHPRQASLILAWAERNEEMVKGPVSGSAALLAEVVSGECPATR